MNNICEHFKKDYSKAVRYVKGNGEMVWEWTCEKCGQIYTEKVKDPIDISEK